ncbi:hypothetical protein FB451DRAFT_1476251 [Mycena latifolia]|nr:hypothetical protein FB451DRAFT_1476251 [Mycena latifolia]
MSVRRISSTDSGHACCGESAEMKLSPHRAIAELEKELRSVEGNRKIVRRSSSSKEGPCFKETRSRMGRRCKILGSDKNGPRTLGNEILPQREAPIRTPDTVANLKHFRPLPASISESTSTSTATVKPTITASNTLANLASSWGVSFGRKKAEISAPFFISWNRHLIVVPSKFLPLASHVTLPLILPGQEAPRETNKLPSLAGGGQDSASRLWAADPHVRPYDLAIGQRYLAGCG